MTLPSQKRSPNGLSAARCAWPISHRLFWRGLSPTAGHARLPSRISSHQTSLTAPGRAAPRTRGPGVTPFTHLPGHQEIGRGEEGRKIFDLFTYEGGRQNRPAFIGQPPGGGAPAGTPFKIDRVGGSPAE